MCKEIYTCTFVADMLQYIYYTEKGYTIVLLLTGGNKSKQSKDIELAQKYINEYNERIK